MNRRQYIIIAMLGTIGLVIGYTMLSADDDGDECGVHDICDVDVPTDFKYDLSGASAYQCGPGTWNASFKVLAIRRGTEYRISEVEIRVIDREGNRLNDSSLEYIDSDADGTISKDDQVLLSNLTEDFLNQVVNITCKGEFVAVTFIKWDSHNPGDFMLQMDLENVVAADEGIWNLRMNITRIHGDAGFAMSSIAYGFVSEKGTVLSSAQIAYVDTDKDGLLSAGDKITLRGLSDRYLHADFQVTFEDTLIGFTELRWDIETA